MDLFFLLFEWDPAGTWHKNDDVVLTSMRRDYVTSTSIRHQMPTGDPFLVLGFLVNIFTLTTLYIEIPVSKQFRLWSAELVCTICIIRINAYLVYKGLIKQQFFPLNPFFTGREEKTCFHCSFPFPLDVMQRDVLAKGVLFIIPRTFTAPPPPPPHRPIFLQMWI